MRTNKLRAIAIIVLLVTPVVQAQVQVFQVPIRRECRPGQGQTLTTSTYHSDPYCHHYATAPGGGCTQWKLIRDGQVVKSTYTVPTGGNPALDFYNSGRFTITIPGTYQIKMSYSRRRCFVFFCNYDVFVNDTPIVTVSSASLDQTNWKPCPLGSYDSANCFVMAKPPGGFIWQRGFYMPASKTSNCPMGSYDGANCYVMQKPPNGFIWMDGFYVKRDSNGNCPLGSFDGANCFISKAAWGTKAFEYNGNFYTTPLPNCAQGSYDGANCLIATAPAGTTLVEWSGNFYVTPSLGCP